MPLLMEPLNQLLSYINLFTFDGTCETDDRWSDDEYVLDFGVELLKKLTSSEWIRLASATGEKSDAWNGALIDLLDQEGSNSSRMVLMAMVEDGADETVLDAMECIHEFIDEVGNPMADKLRLRLAEVLRRRRDAAQQSQRDEYVPEVPHRAPTLRDHHRCHQSRIVLHARPPRVDGLLQSLACDWRRLSGVCAGTPIAAQSFAG